MASRSSQDVRFSGGTASDSGHVQDWRLRIDAHDNSAAQGHSGSAAGRGYHHNARNTGSNPIWRRSEESTRQDASASNSVGDGMPGRNLPEERNGEVGYGRRTTDRNWNRREQMPPGIGRRHHAGPGHQMNEGGGFRASSHADQSGILPLAEPQFSQNGRLMGGLEATASPSHGTHDALLTGSGREDRRSKINGKRTASTSASIVGDNMPSFLNGGNRSAGPSWSEDERTLNGPGSSSSATISEGRNIATSSKGNGRFKGSKLAATSGSDRDHWRKGEETRQLRGPGSQVEFAHPSNHSAGPSTSTRQQRVGGLAMADFRHAHEAASSTASGRHHGEGAVRDWDDDSRSVQQPSSSHFGPGRKKEGGVSKPNAAGRGRGGRMVLDSEGILGLSPRGRSGSFSRGQGQGNEEDGVLRLSPGGRSGGTGRGQRSGGTAGRGVFGGRTSGRGMARSGQGVESSNWRIDADASQAGRGREGGEPSTAGVDAETSGGSGSVQLRPWHQRMDGMLRPGARKGVEEGLGSSKNIPQLLQTLEEQMSKGGIDCMICCEVVGKAAPIWSCSSCYSIFHLGCIKKWARAPTSTDMAAARDMSQPGGDNWRCPGCQTVQHGSAKTIRYLCFCHAVTDPPNDPYVTPHSCGQTCRRPLKRINGSTSNGEKEGSTQYTCPHHCTLRCHPGPCPPCTAMAPSLPCHCKKSWRTQRCAEVESWSCMEQCGAQLSCGRHHCEKICHEGPCPPCTAVLSVNCFCGREQRGMRCSEVRQPHTHGAAIFSCTHECSRQLDCGRHKCPKTCHDGACNACQLAPSRVTTCPCGRTPLCELEGGERACCTDPIPTCSGTCGRVLPCGKHTCSRPCHVGECPPCPVPVAVRCRCGSTSREVACHLSESVDGSSQFLCDSKCGRKKNCGRHRCNAVCCSAQREGGGVDQGGEDPHLCTLPCGKKLRCGVHKCTDLCHAGHCPRCMNPDFAELSCACGQTCILPPVPCGTKLPQCPYPCTIPQVCGHETVHPCHPASEKCPPCAVPTRRSCVGGHVELHNIPCGSKDVKCSALCGKIRQCQAHMCQRMCHSGPCDAAVPPPEAPHLEDSGASTSGSGPSAGSAEGTGASMATAAARGTEATALAGPGPLGRVLLSCGQVCGSPRRSCKHPCASTCHPGTPCPEKWCRSPVTITCRCGHLTAQVPCGSGTGGGGAVEAACIANLPSGLAPLDVGVGGVGGGGSWLTTPEVPLGKRRLNCNEECARLERKRVLAAAFGSGENLDEDGQVPEGCPLELAEAIRKSPQWVHAAEARLHYLLYGGGKVGAVGATSSSRALRATVFRAVPQDRRASLHQLAERWGMVSASVGRDPGRCVVVHVGTKAKIPAKGLLARGPVAGPGQVPLPPFNAELDINPACVVAFVDLPPEERLDELNLRFGGDCALSWLDDKNALATFADPERALTAMRHLEHTCAYVGASSAPPPHPTANGRARSGTAPSSLSRDGAVDSGKSKASSPGGGPSWLDEAWDDENGKLKGVRLGKVTTAVGGLPGGPVDQGPVVVQTSAASLASIPKSNFWGALEEEGDAKAVVGSKGVVGAGMPSEVGGHGGLGGVSEPQEGVVVVPQAEADGNGEDEEEWEKVLRE